LIIFCSDRKVFAAIYTLSSLLTATLFMLLCKYTPFWGGSLMFCIVAFSIVKFFYNFWDNKV
jgi:hypothetical protein